MAKQEPTVNDDALEKMAIGEEDVILDVDSEEDLSVERPENGDSHAYNDFDPAKDLGVDVPALVGEEPAPDVTEQDNIEFPIEEEKNLDISPDAADDPDEYEDLQDYEEDDEEDEEDNDVVTYSLSPRRNKYERQWAEEMTEATRAARRAATTSYGAFRQAVYGQIINVEVASAGMYEGTPSWFCFIHSVTVVIPFQYAFANAPDVRTDEDKKNMLEGCIGIKIPILVSSLEKKANNAYIAHGNHLAALARIKPRYFGKHAPMPAKKGMEYRYPGQILSVQESTMYIEVLGCQLRVPISEVSWRYIDDMPRTYHSGDRIYVCFKHIYDDDGKFNPVISPRNAEIPGFKQLLRNPLLRQRNMSFIGTITSVTKRKAPIGAKAPDIVHISGFNDQIGLPFWSQTWNLDVLEELKSGSRVRYTVVDANLSSGFTLVRITRILNG